jgi:hypothetical protein
VVAHQDVAGLQEVGEGPENLREGLPPLLQVLLKAIRAQFEMG